MSNLSRNIFGSYNMYGESDEFIRHSFHMKKQISENDSMLFMKTYLYDNKREMKYETYDDILRDKNFGWYDLISSVFSGVYTKIFFDYVEPKLEINPLNSVILTETDIENFINRLYNESKEYFYIVNYGEKEDYSKYKKKLNDISLQFSCFLHHIISNNILYENFYIFDLIFKYNEILDKKNVGYFNNLNIFYDQLVGFTATDLGFMKYSNFLKNKRNITGLSSTHYLGFQNSSTLEDSIFSNEKNKDILRDLFIEYIDFNFDKYIEIGDPSVNETISLNRKLSVIMSILLFVKLDLYIEAIDFNFNVKGESINSWLVSKYHRNNPKLYDTSDISTLWNNIKY